MSEWVGIRGELRLPVKAMKQWLSSVARGSAWQDWTGLLRDARLPAGAKLDGRTVEERLRNARKVGKKRTLFDLRVELGEVRLLAMLSQDDDLDTCMDLSVALRAAERLGGKGHVVTWSVLDDRLNTYVEIGDGRSTCARAKATCLKTAREALDAAQTKAGESASSHSLSFAKKAAAFFRISRSISRESTRFRRAEFSSSSRAIFSSGVSSAGTPAAALPARGRGFLAFLPMSWSYQ
jgi:hypothetical protein